MCTFLRCMQNRKSPGSHGLTKEFYETFWNKINSTSEANLQNQLRISQRQVIIKLIEKIDRDERFIIN